MTEPITPADIRKQSDVTAKALTETISYINRILELEPSIALLLSGQEVEVVDNSNFEFWRVASRPAVQSFIDKGWVVKFDRVGNMVVYRFSLPEVE
jgi:hypothetical protein